MKILAVDYGDSRTGLATCDRTEFLTSPITPQITLKARNKVAARVCEVAKEIGAERQTTCAAADLLDESGTYGSKRKEILDSVSATVILDDYLAWRKDHPGEI